MGAIQAPRAKTADWATRSVGPVWRAFDLQLATYAFLLASVGLVMAYSNTAVDSGSVLDPGSTFSRGLTFAIVALVTFGLATAFDYHWFRTLTWPLYLLQLGLLGLTLAIGTGIGGASRWIQVAGIQLQFSELAKILMILTLASYLSARRGRLDGPLAVLGACLLIVPPMVLVMLQPDLGTSLVFGAILVGMLFLSGASLRWVGLLVGGAVAAFPIIWTSVLHDYQRQRLAAFLDPACDIKASCYQLFQSQIAVSSGGWFGKGLTNGTQNRFDFLPVQTTDFVWAILSEELGFLGGVVVLVLFGLLLWRIGVAAWRSKDPFGTVFGAGLASMVLFQIVVNVGMVIGIMPITGIPLPFVTHGGSSLISLAAGIGIMQSINIRQGRAEW